MTDAYDITFTRREISDAILKVGEKYQQLYRNGMMTFQEFSIVENAFIKIQIELDRRADQNE